MKFSKESLREVYGRTLVELGETYKNVVVLDADLNTSTRTVLFKQRFPERFIQFGIAEANMFGAAAGLAKEGFIPFPSTFAAFAARKALDQVYLNICVSKLGVKIPGSYPGMTATECGASHNMADDLAIMRAMPNMRVADAGDANELRSLMHVITDEEGPAYFRVPKFQPPILFDSDYRFEWGKGTIMKTGKDAALVSTGMMTSLCLKAAELLAGDHIDVEVIHMASVKPLDEELLVRTAKKTGCVVTVENGRIYGGFGSAVTEILSRDYPVYVDRIGLGDSSFFSAPLSHLVKANGFSPEDIAIRVKGAVSKKQ